MLFETINTCLVFCTNNYKTLLCSSNFLHSRSTQTYRDGAKEIFYPKLDTRISFVRPSVRHAQGTPPGF